MPDLRPLLPQAGRHRGFTLIELMIAVAIAILLVAVALPAFNSSLRKGRRSEAFAALNAVQQAQERWRANREAYATSLSDLGLPATSSSGRYALELSGPPDAVSYVATATAVADSSQAADGACATMAVRMVRGTVSFGSGSGPDWTDPGRCWAK